ncbi:hypothetical protein [Amycolatopsis tucumanensis]|uniref:Uncharacterized protein n=1 Tax=Amycolatopsis tucumanensis TaxID=401106 RepID=A0ABP7IXV1_9PSEU|nr:hypothetical protein [Amycolatopsis tucumanensis]MCF6423346.1 hypothetical protein [Amycolatopsis tucumanensis]
MSDKRITILLRDEPGLNGIGMSTPSDMPRSEVIEALQRVLAIVSNGGVIQHVRYEREP